MASYADWIKDRTSWRTYLKREIDASDRESIVDFIEAQHFTPFGTKPRFKLIDNDSVNGKIGTYGFIRGAQHFIAGVTRKGPMCMEDYGYAFEKIILYVTGLGLGTCWLGGTFTRNPVMDVLNITDDEVVPAISPVGHKMDRGLVGKALRWGAGSRNRKPWSNLFFKEDFDSPLSFDEAGDYAVGFEMVRNAPSASNGQPWRLVLEGESVHFCHDEKDYSVFKQLDLGIAMSHFDLVNRDKGVVGEWSRDKFSHPRYVATWFRN
jgi:hypothetical protein